MRPPSVNTSSSSGVAAERHFLGWDRPALAAAVDHLLASQAADSGELDLSHLLLVLPGGRASRRMLELLVTTCERRSLRLVPPRLMTVSHLPEQLYEADRPAASDMLSRLCWTAALQAVDKATLQAIAPTPPPLDDTPAWAALAQMVERLYVELAAARMGFADVPERADAVLPDFADHDRFEALAAVQQAYNEQLDQLGRDDQHRARLRALERNACTYDGPICLVAINYVPPITRAMLEQAIAGDEAARLSALIHAPNDRADAFDALGCFVTDAWADAHPPLREEQVEIVQRPVDQAGTVLRVIDGLDGKYPAEQITVGVCDDGVAPYLQQYLPAWQVPVRDAAGTPLNRTAPYRLLAAVADYLEQQRFGDFAALLRHPDLAHHLLEHATDADRKSLDAWLDLLDDYFNDHLQGRVTAHWLGKPERRERMKRVHDAVHHPSLLGRLGGRGPLRAWAEPIVNLLRNVYATRPLDRDRHADHLTIEACARLHQILTDLNDLPTAEDASPIADRQATAAEAIRAVLRQAGDAIPPEPRDTAVELLGPLELQLDDAPVLLITGVNEGKLPASVNADAFLPNTLRSAIGLEDNARRYARDNYALHAILHSRPNVRLIAGRRSAQGDPLAPSRLLFAAEKKVIADRVARFYGTTPTDASPPSPPSLQPAASSRFILPPPLPQPLHDFDHMAVTEFRLYLQCPYRYYLQRALKLKAVDDAAAEMDGMRFGSLAHDVLERFGRSDDAGHADGGRIAHAVAEILHETVREHFGSDPLPAVRVQVKQLESRLMHFAHRHAEWVGQGWRILCVEQDVRNNPAATIEVDGRPMPLHGRIDRVDQHEQTGELALLDYKTGDQAKSPDATHRVGRGQNRRWVDLQLPLYRHLLPALCDEQAAIAAVVNAEAGPAIRLGYVVLPRDPRATEFAMAEWTADELAEADETAQQVVRDIRAGRFDYDPSRPAPPFDAFAALCGTNLLGDDDGDAGGEG